MPFAVKLFTAADPFGHQCHPVFASADEARRYVRQLEKTLGEGFVGGELVPRRRSTVNAVFPAGRRRFLWIMPAGDDV